MAQSNFLLSQATAARRRVFMYLVDATDGITARTAEAGGQPQISKNGGAFANTSATLTAIGNGGYYVELTAGELDTLGNITTRYKSANTAEFQITVGVVAIDELDATAMGISRIDAAITTRLAPTVAARTLDVSAGGEAGLDWANIGSPTTAQNLSGTSTKAVEPTVAGRTLDVSAGGEAGIDWNNIGSPTTAQNLSGTSTKAVEPTVAGRTLDVTATGEAGIDWSNIGAPTTVVALSGTTVKEATDVHTDVTTLIGRLTAARAGFLDNLNVGGNVASSAEATAIQNNTRVVRVVPEVIERPDAGSVTFRIELFLYDDVGNMEAPDSAPTIALVNQAGTDLSARLDSTTMALVSTGRYRAILTANVADALEQLVWTFSVIEGGATRLYGNASVIVDTSAVDFTAADRTKLNRIDTDYTTARAAKIDNLDAAVTTRLAPTTPARTLDVTATGEAGIDWSNVGAPTSVVGLTGTTVKTSTDVETRAADIQSRLPATLDAGNMRSSIKAIDAAIITAATIAGDALTAAKIAADVGVELATAFLNAFTDGARTVRGALARADAFVSNRAKELNSATPGYYADDGVTLLIETTQNVVTGARTVPTTKAGD